MRRNKDCRVPGCDNEATRHDWKEIYVCDECYKKSQKEAIGLLSETDKQVYRAMSCNLLCRMEISYRTKIPCDDVQASFEKLADLLLVRKGYSRFKDKGRILLYGKWGREYPLAKSIPEEIG